MWWMNWLQNVLQFFIFRDTVVMLLVLDFRQTYRVLSLLQRLTKRLAYGAQSVFQRFYFIFLLSVNSFQCFFLSLNYNLINLTNQKNVSFSFIFSQEFGNCLHILDSKESPLTCCAFSFDGSFIAAGKLSSQKSSHMYEGGPIKTETFHTMQNSNIDIVWK